MFQREVNVFLRNLCRSEGNPLDLNSPLALSASNVICSIIMNIRFHLNDPRFQRYTHLIEEGFKLFGGVMQYVNFIPILGYLPGQQKTKQKIEAVSINARYGDVKNYSISIESEE